MKHPSPRIMLATMTLALLGGTTAAAAAAESDETAPKKHAICLINQDPTAGGAQKGVCLVWSDPTLP